VSLYIDDMKGAYENSDLVVCRAGATTCAELSAAGRPAILVPLALAGAHQETNARMMEGAGAARQLAADERTPETFARVVTELMDEPETRERMATEARALARPGAAGAVAEQLEALALGKERA
jgi:UDP-N-acetylglucosamine--N-acetylmuramyl-(pentapeptide) pyrophosphoryl-undecaprenol N-acetylglucosamine transferase